MTLSSTNNSFRDPGDTRTPDEAGMSSRSSRSDKACRVLGAESRRAAEPQGRRPALHPSVPTSSAPLSRPGGQGREEKSDAYVIILQSMKCATISIMSYKQFTYLNLKISYSIAKKCYASSEPSVSPNLFLVESLKFCRNCQNVTETRGEKMLLEKWSQ